MGFMLDGIVAWFAGAILDVLTALIGAITRVLLITPDVTRLPQVQALTGRSVAVVDTVFVLAFVAAHFSQLIAGKLIELANALTRALTAGDLDRDAGLGAVATHLSAARDRTAGLLFVACAAI